MKQSPKKMQQGCRKIKAKFEKKLNSKSWFRKSINNKNINTCLIR